MLEIDKNNVHFNLFDNVYEFSKFLTTKQRKSGRDNESESASVGFTGTRSFDEAMNLMIYGDEGTLKEVLKEQSKIKISNLLGNVTNRQRYENNLYGCVPNVPNCLMNIPYNMINSIKDRPSHKIVNIFLNMDCTAWVSQNDILKAGVKYLTIIDLLEKHGYRCNLYAGVSSEKYNHNFYMLVRVKTDREPLNLKKICFTIANPSFLRRMYFRWCEVFDFPHDITDGYGHSVGTYTCVEDFKKNIKDDFIIWCYQDEETRRCDIQTVIKRLKEKGIDLIEGDK